MNKIYIADDNIWTSAGMAAVIDLAVGMVSVITAELWLIASQEGS